MTMQRRLALTLTITLAFGSSAWAVTGDDVVLYGGTVKAVATGTVGVLDLSSTTAMVFRARGKEISIPYEGLNRVAAASDVKRQMGVLPAIAVALVMARQRRHTITLTFDDADGKRQVVIFEVAKAKPAEILATVEARAPAACGTAALACKPHQEGWR